MQKSLDRAIMLKETTENPDLTACYWVNGYSYENYLSNNSWNVFKEDMKRNHAIAYAMYGQGGGKEMEERKVGNFTYPPKMASFGSSSRMVYNLMKGNPKFLYEKKLPTTVGGMANLDGFIETDEKCIFVEAKCREPYGAKNREIAEKYKILYEFLTKSDNNNLICYISPAKKGKIEVAFFAGQKELQFFDIKQMVCHLLGIATAYLQEEYNKNIDFIYLLYNPTNLYIENVAHREAILHIYNNECQECDCIDFNGLFYDILTFLNEQEQLETNKDIKKLSEAFSFRLCDQHTIKI